MAILLTKHTTPSQTELRDNAYSVIFSYGYNTVNNTKYAYGTIWTQGKQYGHNVYTTTTSYNCYLPILVASYYNGGYVTAYHSTSVLVNPGTGQFKAVNFDGDFNGNFNGDFEGSFNGEFDGKFDGEFSGYAYAYGTFNGDFNGDFDGSFNGNITGNGVLNGYVSSSYMTVISQKTDNVEYAVPFTPTSSTANNSYLYRDDVNGIKYNPSTNILTTGVKPLKDNITSNITIGSVKSGDVISKNSTIEEILRSILCKTIGLNKTNPTATITISPTSINAGSTVNISYTITLNDGKYTSVEPENWQSTQYAGCELDKVAVKLSTISNENYIDIVNKSAGTQYTGTISVTADKTGSGKTLYFGYCYTGGNKPKNNQGAEVTENLISAGYGTTTKTISFKYKYEILFRSADININVNNAANYNTFTGYTASEVNIPANSTKPYICIIIPNHYKLSKIMDAFGATDLTNSFSMKTGTDSNGVTYKIYYYNNPANLVFKNISITT
jgi:hypothetical protein